MFEYAVYGLNVEIGLWLCWKNKIRGCISQFTRSFWSFRRTQLVSILLSLVSILGLLIVCLLSWISILEWYLTLILLFISIPIFCVSILVGLSGSWPFLYRYPVLDIDTRSFSCLLSISSIDTTCLTIDIRWTYAGPETIKYRYSSAWYRYWLYLYSISIQAPWYRYLLQMSKTWSSLCIDTTF